MKRVHMAALLCHYFHLLPPRVNGNETMTSSRVSVVKQSSYLHNGMSGVLKHFLRRFKIDTSRRTTFLFPYLSAIIINYSMKPKRISLRRVLQIPSIPIKITIFLHLLSLSCFKEEKIHFNGFSSLLLSTILLGNAAGSCRSRSDDSTTSHRLSDNTRMRATL